MTQAINQFDQNNVDNQQLNDNEAEAKAQAAASLTALSEFFSQLSNYSGEEKDADQTPPPPPQENDDQKILSTNWQYILFQAMENADLSTGNRMVASADSEIDLGTNLTNDIYNAWTSNHTTISESGWGPGFQGTGDGILGAITNLFQNIANANNSDYNNYLSEASTLEAQYSSTANTNEGTMQQQTQTWANQLSNDSQDEQGLITTIVPDIVGFGQQMAGYLGTPLPA